MSNGPPVSSHYYGIQRVARENLARLPQDWNFKSDQDFREYTEHISPNQGREMLQLALADFPEIPFLEPVRKLASDYDSIGMPFASYQTYCEPLGITCSPQNMQWMWHALMFLRHLRNQSVSHAHVVELGSGSGGMALYVCGLAELFAVTVDSYTLIDLPEMAQLQETLCRTLHVPVEGIDGSDSAALHSVVERAGPKALFSALAFAEYDPDIQAWYVEHLIRHCSHGFLIWNTYAGWSHRGPNPVYQFIDKPLMIEDNPIPTYNREWHMQRVYW